jgi:hypothetical protein
MFEKKFAKKVQKYYKLSEGGRGGREGGELSFQCLRPSTSLMAAGKKAMSSIGGLGRVFLNSLGESLQKSSSKYILNYF